MTLLDLQGLPSGRGGGHGGGHGGGSDLSALLCGSHSVLSVVLC
jgi:predicted heme/steroid binding protein